ncbi:hypothetical protein PoB_005306000 [Plakobranchus ocellatus]|uniref:Uncharacterized protein n=1 Tax=Plakobranchus ocellatus TaxID=259542 RepID=A0AAV4C4K6_9GAST|nr:hypothetical protein PoB_005306000 [Plakobranchus ocellatus]
MVSRRDCLPQDSVSGIRTRVPQTENAASPCGTLLSWSPPLILVSGWQSPVQAQSRLSFNPSLPYTDRPPLTNTNQTFRKKMWKHFKY